MADTNAKASIDPGYCLVVRNAFLDYQIGDRITDADKIAEILSGEMACYVYKAAKAD